jgi:hypothetical protein
MDEWLEHLKAKNEGTKINHIYCHVLPGNASNNLWVLGFMPGLLDIHQAEFTINYLLHSQSYCKHTALILHPLTSYFLVCS